MADAPRKPTRDTAGLIFRNLLAIAAALCLITAGQIEYWNWKAGGAIQQKLEHGPDSKWRMGTYAGEFSFGKSENRQFVGKMPIVNGSVPLLRARSSPLRSDDPLFCPLH